MSDKGNKRANTPPITTESKTNKLIALTLAQVEYQLTQKTASSQTLAHYLNLATEKEKATLKKMELEAQLLEAKIESEKTSNNGEEMLARVLDALQSYGVNHRGQ